MTAARTPSARSGSGTSPLTWLLLLCLVLGGVAVLRSEAGSAEVLTAPRAKLGTLPPATTDATLRRAPRDDGRGTTDGEVVRPRRQTAVYAEPAERPFAKVGRRQMGPLWLPVLDRHRGWVEVMLPSRPNGSVGWIRESDLTSRTTPYVVRVHRGSRTLELQHDGRTVGTWPVAVGAPGTPTPTGRTFLLGSITDERQSYSPVILPLGTHSRTLDSYGGGPGTVALHGWPDRTVFGTAASHGCVRVPDDALARLSQVPLGSLVIIDRARHRVRVSGRNPP